MGIGRNVAKFEFINELKKFISCRKYEEWIFLLIGLILALVLRVLLRGYVSGDAVTGSLPWYDFIERHQGLEALKHAFSGYPPLYLYMLVTVYYANQLINVSHLAAIKSISIVFDFFAAFWFAKIVQVKFPGKTTAFIAALVFLFLPTVFLNGAMWGQIDGVFTSFLLAAFYYILKGRSIRAMIFFGLGFSIKFQAVFLAPFLLLLLLLKRLSWRSVLMVPLVYCITLIPAWIIGRPISQLLLLYFNQATSFDTLSLNAPTFYALIDNSVNYLFIPGGMVIAAATFMILIFAIYKMCPCLGQDLQVGLAAVCLFLLPYILPMMHERYFFPAEVFFFLFAFFRPRISFVAAGLQITALATYSAYFFGPTFLSLSTASLIMLGLLVFALYEVAKMLALANPASSGNPPQLSGGSPK